MNLPCHTGFANDRINDPPAVFLATGLKLCLKASRNTRTSLSKHGQKLFAGGEKHTRIVLIAIDRSSRVCTKYHIDGYTEVVKNIH